MKLPSDFRWTQTNDGDIIGLLHETKQVTFDRQGKLKLSNKPVALYTSDDDAEFKYPLGIVYFNSRYVVLTSDKLFNFDLQDGIVSKIASSPTVALNSDILVIYDRMYVTVNNNLSYWDGASWTNSIESLTAGVPHPMTSFDSLTTYKLAVGNGTTVKLIDSSGNASANVLTLPSQYQVSTLSYLNGYLYVGTKNTNGGEAKVFIWDGNSTSADYEVSTGGTWVFSLTQYGSSIVGVTDQGELLQISGSSRTRLAAFPIFYEPNLFWSDSSGLNLNGKVFHRGMVAVGDTIYINIDGALAKGFLPEMKDGVWVYDPENGLYHRCSRSVDRYVSEKSLSLASNTLTTSAAHGLKTGDAVEFVTTSGLSGVDNQVPYYVNVVSSTEIKLAISRKSLQNGTYLDITGTPNVGDNLIYTPSTDWAAGYRGAQGAIALVSNQEPALAIWQSPVIWGGLNDDLDGNTHYSLNIMSNSFNIGGFTTQRIYSSEIDQAWQSIYVFLDGIHNDVEEIIIKTKSGNEPGYPTEVIQGVWGSSNTIHSLPETYDEDAWADLKVGDELTFVNGYGRGYTAHIQNIEKGASVYVLTLDESIGTTNKNVYFYADNFKKQTKIGNGRREDYVKASIPNEHKSWIQIKVELRGFQPEVSHLELVNQVKKGRL